MRRVLLALLVLASHSISSAYAPQDRPLQADGIVRLLADLEGAIATGRVEDFRALAAASIPASAVECFVGVTRRDVETTAVIRERTRRAMDQGYEVLTDVLVSRGRQGRLATWVVSARPSAGGGAFEVTNLRELAVVDGLVRLALDTSRQFSVHDLVISAPDLTLHMASGSAFVAESANGVTGLVLRGKGDVVFSPPDPAEQGQLRIFNKRPTFAAPVDAVFLRVNPAEFAFRVSQNNLTPTDPTPSDVRAAQEIFDDMAPRTYNVDLRNLTADSWSLEPTSGSVVVELRARRYGWLTYARSPADPEDISFFDRAHRHIISVYASPQAMAEHGRFYSDEDTTPYDVDSYRLDLTFDPSRLWISGRGSMHVKVKAAALSTLSVKLAQSLAVSSVSSPTLGELLALKVIGQNTLLVNLPTALERGDEITLNVMYSGRLEPQSLDREAMAVQGQIVGVQDPLTMLVTPEPRFMYSNRVHWYPHGPVPGYATAHLRLTVPAEYQIVASGSLIRAVDGPGTEAKRDNEPSLRTVEYVADRPVRYLSCLISRFVPIGRTPVEVPAIAASALEPPTAPPVSTPAVNVEVVATPRTTSRGRQLSPTVATILRFYARTVGDAPYPDFTLAAVDDNLPGGHSPAYFAMVHQPLASTPYSWASDPVAFDNLYPPFFLAHEIAHQWWGQAVGWKNYHEQWLSEGLAQYFAVIYAAADRGPDMQTSIMAAMRTSMQSLLGQGPISLGYRLGHLANDGRIFRALVYNKSVIVLHMLRRLIGDDAFFDGVRRFYATWRFKRAGTDDFRVALEASSGMSLTRFFDRWVGGFAMPKVRLSWTVVDDGRSAVVRVTQVGDVYDFPLTVAVQFRDGRSEELTLKVLDRTAEQRVPLNGGAIRRVIARDPLTLFELAR